MQQLLTETEQKVIDILIQHPVTADAYHSPIHAVDRAMGWPTAETLKFVRDLRYRNLVHAMPIVRMGRTFDPRWEWKKGSL